MTSQDELHLRVYGDRSVLFAAEGTTETFLEGPLNATSQRRLADIEEALKNGYFTNLIEGLRSQNTKLEGLDDEQSKLLSTLVDSITSEVGRALVGLAVLLLAIKDIAPKQSIRLHKGSPRQGSFSWQDGLPMRSLDSKYNTPFLRHQGLLRLNNFGVFMTRSLAENYPYSIFYKAAMRGAKAECFTLIDWVETGRMRPRPLLECLISMLINRSELFRELGDRAIESVQVFLNEDPQPSSIRNTIESHLSRSPYGARLLEIAMHSLIQVLDEQSLISGKIAPLSQMRSANKKHGNVADIEIVSNEDASLVLEAWDAKYGRPYLRDELEELSDKLEDHPETAVAGFVVDRQPEIDEEIESRIEDLSIIHDVDISILSFASWVDLQVERASADETMLMKEWIVAYTETLARRRPEVAPIDEPADKWLEDLLKLLTS